jgi:hypothetical protein
MTRDLDLNFDPELERRLRDIARAHEPEMPVRIGRYAADIAAGRAVRAVGGDLVMQRVRRPALIPRPGKTALVLATAAVVVAVGMAGLFALRPSVPASSANPQAPDQWSGLAWRDVTARALPAGYVSGDTLLSIVRWHGTYYLNPGALLWSSPDGAKWHRVEGAPGAFAIAATDDLLFLVDGSCTPLSYTADGRTWQTADLPAAGAECPAVSSLAATPSAIVAVIPENSPASPLTVSVPYRSSDGATWTESEVPADMATALHVGVAEGRAGFLARGLVPDPSSIQLDNHGGASWSGDTGFWYSPDGSSWQQTTVPADVGPIGSYTANMNPGPLVQRGSLGDWLEASGHGYHSLDDLTWLPDSMPAAMSGGSLKITSDGTRILAQPAGPTFFVSLGDGTWQQLGSSGVDALPDGGRSWVMPAGVLYIADGRAFFGTPIQG